MIRLTGLKLSVDHEKSDIYTAIYDKCGGYNLQFAFATGLLVGDSI